jgi:glycosyltransferase involved in cell wall biosynthesis
VTKDYISVIIPAYNCAETIGLCLDSLSHSQYRLFECIVVDDHSEDETSEIARSFDSRVISLDHKEGAAHARNRGAEEARGDILLFIDADVTVYPDCLLKVSNSFAADPQVSALFGSYDDDPGRTNFLSQYRNLMHHFIHQSSQLEASTFWSACGAVRRDVFFAVGKYNENTRMMEDIELGYRLKAHNFKIFLNKEIRVKHWKRYSFARLLRSDLFDRAIPWTELMWRYRQFTRDLNLQGKHKLSGGIIILLFASLLGGIYSPWAISAVPVLLLLYFLLNRDFYKFFYHVKGLFFTVRVIPLHLLYYIYSMLGFVIGTGKYFLAGSLKSKSQKRDHFPKPDHQ